MSAVLSLWHKAAVTSLGLFWMALWAFCLGYMVSAVIQVFVTRERMQRAMGDTGPKSVALGTFFGFISSSCSFAALSTTRSLFTKGAGLIPSLAFLLASTNLVIELGIVISIFLSWQFVVGEYVGGLLLILVMWLVVALTLSSSLEEGAREHAQEREGDGNSDEQREKELGERLKSLEQWGDVAQKYLMEWKMVWKDVLIGFTVAGIIAAFVPKSFFEGLFVGAGQAHPGFFQVLLQTIVGPVVAFFTFIGSMGNIPLAAVLFGNGVSFAGIIAFIFSDLVVFPVLRIQTEYYGWKMALYIMGVFLVALIVVSLLLHYGLAGLGMLPSQDGVRQVAERSFFKVDYSLVLNLLFLGLSGWFGIWRRGVFEAPIRADSSPGDKVFFGVAMVACAWLLCGLAVGLWL